jgi:3-hydroxyacyl-CoA dehydrogenase
LHERVGRRRGWRRLHGSGIAQSVAAVGKRALRYEPAEPPLERSREQLGVSLERAIGRGKLSAEDAARLSDRVIYTTCFEDLSGADAVG